MTVRELSRQLELCDPDMEVRLYIEYDEHVLKYNSNNVLKRIHRREAYLPLTEVSVEEDKITLEGIAIES